MCSPGGEVHAKDHLAANLHAFQEPWLWASARHGLVADLEQVSSHTVNAPLAVRAVAFL